MDIIIAGAGKVGATLTGTLSAEGHDITLIDSNKQVLDSIIEKYDIMAVCGNCATMGVLRQAGAEKADLLIVTTDADEINLLTCMTSHAINAKMHTIARIRNPEYSGQIYQMRSTFALSLVVNPEKMAAVEIERLLKYPGFLKRESFAKDRAEIVELRVEDNSKLNGVSLSNLNSIIKCKVLVCTVLRNGTAIMPDGSFVLKTGDRVFVTAATNVLTILLKNLGIITKRVNKVLLAGGSKTSVYLAERLLKSNIDVSVIEKDYDRCRELAELLPGADIVCGDAGSFSFLESEGAAEFDAVVSLTGLDEMNIVISLYANDLKINQIITKMGHAENSNILDRLPIGSIVCPKELCSNTIVRYVRAMQKQSGAAISVHTIASGKAEAVEFLVDEKTLHIGEPLKKLKLKKNVLIVCISHSGTTEIPNGDSNYSVGDIVVVVTRANTVLMQLNDIFE